MSTGTRQSLQSSARVSFWTCMAAALLVALAMSVPAVPRLLLWTSVAGLVLGGAKFLAAVARMPRGAGTMWSLIGAWGLLLAVLAFTI